MSLCITATSCKVGAVLTLHPAAGSSSCGVLKSNRIHFPACVSSISMDTNAVELCADPEGTEFAVTLAACTSDGTYGFRAIFAESKAELVLAVALP